MIRAEGVTKIFGPDPDAALQLLGQGRSKDDIRAETGHTVGVNDIRTNATVPDSNAPSHSPPSPRPAPEQCGRSAGVR